MENDGWTKLEKVTESMSRMTDALNKLNDKLDKNTKILSFQKPTKKEFISDTSYFIALIAVTYIISYILHI